MSAIEARPAAGGAGLAERLATRRAGLLLVAAAGVALLALLAGRSYPGFDGYYTLLWGDRLASGHLPDYSALGAPAPHPLWELVGMALAPTGLAADRLLVLVALGSWVALLVAVFGFTERLLGTLVALLATALLIARTDIALLAARATVDVPFLALVFWAALLELRSPRRGWPVLALLALAGLLRPEAWLVSAAYAIWLAPSLGLRRTAPYALLALAGPALWIGSDWAVTGKPLYSLTTGPGLAALKHVPRYIGGSDRYVNGAVGAAGLLLAFAILRRRAALPFALLLATGAAFVAATEASSSVGPPYLLVPSVLCVLGAATALGGWTVVPRGWPRRATLVLAACAVGVLAWRASDYVRDLRGLDRQISSVERQHARLASILDNPEVVPLLDNCRPLTAPTPGSVPAIRFLTGLPQDLVEASTAQARPAQAGLLLIGRSARFEPSGAEGTPKWWTNYPLSTFALVAANARWRVYARCP